MKIFVTGANGGLGRSACEFLAAKGVEVLASSRQALRWSCPGVIAMTPIDLSDSTQINTLAAQLEGVDAVWHCAAFSNDWGLPEQFENGNIKPIANLIPAIELAQVPVFVHISTPALYFDYSHRYNVTETAIAKVAVNDYARTKLMGEQLIQRGAAALKVKTIVLRPRAIFGPYDTALLPRILKVAQARGGELPLPRGGEAVLDVTYADNVAEAMWQATLAAPRLKHFSVYNVTNDAPVVLKDFMLRVVKELRDNGHPGFSIKPVPYSLLNIAAKAMELKSALTLEPPMLTSYGVGVLNYDMTLSIERAKNDLGYEPLVDVQEGIKKSIRAYISNAR